MSILFQEKKTKSVIVEHPKTSHKLSKTIMKQKNVKDFQTKKM